MTSIYTVVTLLIAAVFTTSSSQEQSPAQSCNGDPNFCGLRLDQFSLPGSHSAGSGFDGDPRECDGNIDNSCVFRNHDLSITQQLDLGIRYLSLDVCFLASMCNDSLYGDLGNTRLVACQGSETDITFDGYAYGGSFMKLLGQIDDWMSSNTGEVIGIHFTRNMPLNEREPVFNGLVMVLEQMWGERTQSATEMNTYYSDNSETWPTLGQAIRENRRIFVFMDGVLVNMDTMSRTWIHQAPTYNYEPIEFSRTCFPPEITHSCNDTGDSDLVTFTGFTLRVCIRTGQTACNVNLYNLADMCHSFRRDHNRTVNMVLVDFPEIGMGVNSVFSIVRELNVRNVRDFLGITATAPSPLVTTPEDSNYTGSDFSTDLALNFSDTSGTTSSNTAFHSHLFIPHHIILCFVTFVTCQYLLTITVQ